MEHTDKLLWLFMLKRANVIYERSHYGVSIDIESTQKIRKLMEEQSAALDNAIDWDKTEQVKQDSEYKFAGTFINDEKVAFLEGHLKLVNQKESLHFYLELEDMNVKDVIFEVLKTI